MPRVSQSNAMCALSAPLSFLLLLAASLLSLTPSHARLQVSVTPAMTAYSGTLYGSSQRVQAIAYDSTGGLIVAGAMWLSPDKVSSAANTARGAFW
jgi:hypothetical protein